MTIPNAENENLENRVLVLMPTGRDASLICSTLKNADIAARACANPDDLEEEINRGAGAVLLAEEALKKGTLERLIESLNRQPIWSDLPVVLFASSGKSAETLLTTVGTRLNATIVERPIRITMLISSVRGALRAREKQYQSRNLLNQLEESDRQKDLFLATLSHELRTPLNSILGWIQMLNGEETSKYVNLKHALSVIERNAKAQSEMITDILFVSRIITGKLKLNLEQTNLISVVESAIEIMRPSLGTKEISLKTSFDLNINQIEGDPDRLQQVFCNLLSNAIKFTPQNGQIEVRATEKNSVVEIEISDSGQGIKPEFLPYVFERFRQADNSYTRQVGGLGLGLAIVRHLVELHGGTVSVRSEGENRGATFTVTLPASTGDKSETASERVVVAGSRQKSEKTKLSNGIRLLLVEDDEDSREMLRVMFEQNNIKVFPVDTAAKALESIARIRPDVLISDIGLPGEDGYELISKVRQLAPEKGGQTPAIALTGYASLQDRDRAFDVGYQEHLTKPVDIARLLGLIEKLISRSEVAEAENL
jgi:signal transduction histidine kinase/CheY-like chemotaxis protein